MWGTDFEMIAHLMPGRTRREIRNKYNTESRKNPIRLDQAFARKIPIGMQYSGLRWADADRLMFIPIRKISMSSPKRPASTFPGLFQNTALLPAVLTKTLIIRTKTDHNSRYQGHRTSKTTTYLTSRVLDVDQQAKSTSRFLESLPLEERRAKETTSRNKGKPERKGRRKARCWLMMRK